MIFQDPTTSLNPVLTVGYQLIEPLKFHRAMDPHQAKEAAVQLLDRVGIPQARLRLKHYPHEFSGGMRQAGDDCHGPRMPAAVTDCGRADHGS